MLIFSKIRQDNAFAYYRIIEQSPEEYDKYFYENGGKEISVQEGVCVIRSCSCPEFCEGTESYHDLYLRGDDPTDDLKDIVVPLYASPLVENVIKRIGILQGSQVTVPLPSLEES